MRVISPRELLMLRHIAAELPLLPEALRIANLNLHTSARR